MAPKEIIHYLVNSLITSIDQSISKRKPSFCISVVDLKEHNLQMNTLSNAKQWTKWISKTRISVTLYNFHGSCRFQFLESLLQNAYLNCLPVRSSQDVTRSHSCATNHIFTGSNNKMNLQRWKSLANVLKQKVSHTSHWKLKYLYTRRLDLSQSFCCTKYCCGASHVKLHQFNTAAWTSLDVVATTAKNIFFC